jgi:hypothetical protein
MLDGHDQHGHFSGGVDGDGSGLERREHFHLLAMARKSGAAGAAADSNSKAAIENAREILLMATSTAWEQ